MGVAPQGGRPRSSNAAPILGRQAALAHELQPIQQKTRSRAPRHEPPPSPQEPREHIHGIEKNKRFECPPKAYGTRSAHMRKEVLRRDAMLPQSDQSRDPKPLRKIRGAFQRGGEK